MASHKSAIKANRQGTKRRLRNRNHRSRLRSQVKKMRAALASGNVEAARATLPETLSLVDRSVKHGVLHRNSAARTKSRLSRALARAAAGKP
jgi:small subunit ribosomal protein S20